MNFIIREKIRAYGALIIPALLPLAFNQCAGTKNFISPADAQRIVIQYLDEQKPEETACCDRKTLKGEKNGNRYEFFMKGCRCPCIITIDIAGKDAGLVRQVGCD